MSKYLYGAAVQGIQDFIFKTNELRHIVGASELVEQICTSAFDEFAKNGESVVRAAGNIKFIFDNEEDCRKAVREFPKKVMTMAPGVTISQAVIQLGDDFGKAINQIESLLKVQRNKPQRSVACGLMGIKRTNNTGLPVVTYKDEYKDESTIQKECYEDTKGLCIKSFGVPNLSSEAVAYDINEITGKNDWIAIIHADGNGLGKVVQKVGKNKDVFSRFSLQLDFATKEAAQIAYSKVAGVFHAKSVIPIRPVVLSGDDMTVIIRGDLAIQYANAFIKAFEEKTKEHLGDIFREQSVFAEGEDYLTACAGIAFTKSSYPFYYGYQLAEELCCYAKKDTKAIYEANSNHLPPSCLLFHKIQDSFIVSYEDIIKRELTARDGLSFKAGPYYVYPQNGKNTVDNLLEASKSINAQSEDGVKSGLRNWISLRLESKSKANQRKNRMLQVFSDENAKETIEKLTSETDNRCMAFDVLAYNTVMNQQTKD